jgi:hypothetical protein
MASRGQARHRRRTNQPLPRIQGTCMQDRTAGLRGLFASSRRPLIRIEGQMTPGTTPQRKADNVGRWAVTMTKVRIRKVLSRTRWQLVTFCGKGGGEARGVVDLLAVRKDHRRAIPGAKRGDILQIILIQVKGGGAAMPTAEDGQRLRVVAKWLHAGHILLATWKKGHAVRFSSYRLKATKRAEEWIEVSDRDAFFVEFAPPQSSRAAD